MSNRHRYYDQSSLWDRPLVREEQERLDLVRAVWPDDVATVLDVGCGAGAIGNYLPPQLTVVGIDFSREALKHFRRASVRGSASALPFGARSFDLAICADTLEHLVPEDFAACVAELKRVAGRYLLVTSPHAEDLGANSTRCRGCGTVFHVNWHIRSLSRDDLEELFSDGFELRCFSFFGHGWLRKLPLLTRLEQALAGHFCSWADAVCPLCGLRQGNMAREASQAPWWSRLPALDSMFTRVRDSCEDNRSEVLLLFERATSARLSRSPSNKLSALVIPPPGKRPTAELFFRHRQTVDTGSPLCASPVSMFDPPRGYVLTSELMDWGEPYVLDGRVVRNYENRGGKDGHAVFVLPWEPLPLPTLAVLHKDVGTEVVAVQVYDPGHGYVEVGTLAGQASGNWVESVFPLPAGLRPGPEGLMGHFITHHQSHPRESHPVKFIGFPGRETHRIKLRFRTVMEDGRTVLVAAYPVRGPRAQWETLVRTSEDCLVMIGLADGVRYVLGFGQELPVPAWIRESPSQIQRLKTELEAAAMAAAHETESLRHALSEREAQLAAVRAAISALEAEMARLQETLSERRAETDQLREAVVARDAEILQVREDFASLAAQVGQLGAALATERVENRRVADVLASSHEEIGRLRESVVRSQREIMDSQRALEQRERDVASLRSGLAEAKEIGENELRRATEVVRAKEVEIGRLREQLAELEAGLQSARADFQAFREGTGIRQLEYLRRLARRWRGPSPRKQGLRN